MTIKAVLFDRDGVLTYFDLKGAEAYFRPLFPISVYELAARWQQWGAQVGFPRSLAEEQVFLRGFWNRMADEFELAPPQRSQLLALDYARFIVAYPEAAAVLAELKARGLRIGVLSNFSLASLESSLAAAGLAQWIDVACAATVIGASKPSAAAYHAALAALDVTAEQCLFLDDEPECVAGAQQVGMRAWLVDRAGNGGPPSAGRLADRVLGDLLPVPTLVQQVSPS